MSVTDPDNFRKISYDLLFYEMNRAKDLLITLIKKKTQTGQNNSLKKRLQKEQQLGQLCQQKPHLQTPTQLQDHQQQ